MNKRRFVFGLLTIALAFNLAIGAKIYFYSAQAAEREDVYDQYKIFAEVVEKVKQEYVDGGKLTYQDLVHGALKGMLNTLDPHSEFMEATKFDELKKDTEGEFGGVGVVIQLSKEKFLTVVAPMEDTPGFRAGIMTGDRILKID